MVFLRSDLEMNLKTGITCFQQWRVVPYQKFIDSAKSQFIWLPGSSLRIDSSDQSPVPEAGKEIVHAEIIFSQCGQYSRENDMCILLIKFLLYYIVFCLQFSFFFIMCYIFYNLLFAID